MTALRAAAMILFAFLYATATVITPLTGHWGKFAPEGLLLTCSFDYLTDTWEAKTYSLFIFGLSFCLPMVFIVWFYGFIVKAVVEHERALKEQAK